jgi:hypothetical protein
LNGKSKRPVGPLPPSKPRHRPGTAPALGLRAEGTVAFLPQTASAKETTMLFRSPIRSRKQRRRVLSVQQSPRRCAARLRVEALENRSLLSGTVTLTPSDDSPLVGEPVNWTATAVDVGAAAVYQFSAAPHGGTFQVVRDFSPANSFAWTPMQEGTYDIEVVVKDGYQATEIASAVVTDAVTSRATGSEAVVTPTANPLVALYSVPPSTAGTVFVQFAQAGNNPSWRNTDVRSVVPGKSTNLLIAGMLPNTTYEMRHVFNNGTGSAPLLFTTGAISPSVVLPSFTVIQPPGPGSDLDQDLLFQQVGRTIQNMPVPYVTDLTGQLVWYYDASQAGLNPGITGGASLVPGGTVLVNAADSREAFPTGEDVVREIDLAGNTLRETNLDAVNAQLTAMGHEVISSFTHDVTRLPSGQTAVIALTERNVDKSGTPTYYEGDDILVLDRNFQVSWVWDSFDHMDINRGPVLGETVLPSARALDPGAAVPVLPVVDWLHANSVNWSPADGDLTISFRHQDWVVKIDYKSGAGDGHVVWRLGQGGDFTLDSTDPNPWFSHQHNAHYLDDSTLILFDNGDTRRASDPNAHSRGQVWTLDEQTMTATQVVNADLGNYSDALGAAQRLSNGDYSFTSGRQGQAPNQIGQSIEVRQDGTQAYVLQVNRPLYRSYRMRTLYEGIDDALAGAPRNVESVVVNDGSAQRSMVNRITVNFDGGVILDPGAIELRRQNGTLVNFQLVTSMVGGKTQAVLAFAGSEFVGGSLADGRYTLTILADHVHDRWGRSLDGDGDGSAGGNRVDAVFRLFGDTDGDGDVDLRDLARFMGTLGRQAGDPRYQWYSDINGDGRVDAVDLIAFARRLGSHLEP